MRNLHERNEKRMKRILLPAAALVVLALTLGGCTMDGDKIVVTDPPRVTSNVTSSPAPVTPEAPSMTPNAPGGGSEPDQGSGLTSGNGIDQGSSAGTDGAAGQNNGTGGVKHTARPSGKSGN